MSRPALLLQNYQAAARILAWIGAAAIVVLSVVPAEDRPVFDPAQSLAVWAGNSIEHVSAFALVAAAFAIGYRFSWDRLVANRFCLQRGY